MSWTRYTSPNFPFPNFLPNLKSLSFTPSFVEGRYLNPIVCFPDELVLNLEKLEFWLFGVVLSALSSINDSIVSCFLVLGL